MSIYTKQGWVNIPYIITNYNPAIIVLVGGRGIGKTYNVLDFCFFNTVGDKWFYLRRTQEELEACCNDELNPFKELNNKYDKTVHFEKQRKIYTIKDDECVYGVASSLSSVGKIRGMSGLDYTGIIYDECLKPLNSRRIMKDEGFEFLNLYETLNRNRELQGLKPLRAFLLSNSNSIGNDLFISLGLVQPATRIKDRGEYPGIYCNNSLLYIDFGDSSPISEKKKSSLIYKISNNKSFNDMALNNEYIGEDYYSNIRKRAPLIEYKPIASISHICIYQHKSNGTYYICSKKQGSPKSYNDDIISKERFRRDFSWLFYAYISGGYVYFDTYDNEVFFRNLFKI